uniref:DDB1- and CUL4-associated factor 15 WD40 repeat-containing domain-containing protein n=1 Tax=Homalodisca liturata TaxID=320908 RepID=A0A1B6H7S5_9HEMI
MQRTKQHLLQKLYSREIHGSFVRGQYYGHNKAVKLFNSIPDRLMFYLKDVIQHMGNHILVGTTRCGQFLITYSYATDLRLGLSGKLMYKYRLHWWAFRPGAAASKVAEVQLFDNQDVETPLTVAIAQWPKVNDKLIIYGYSNDGYDDQEDGDVESRRFFITVTTLPSLHNCHDCKSVAESFDEEEMASYWDSSIGLSCLKHGLTIHTTLDMAQPPSPSFDYAINLKIDNKIIINTGNFLHVLLFGSDQGEVTSSHDDNIVPAEINHYIGEKLSSMTDDYICPWKTSNSSGFTVPMSRRKTLTRSVNKAWLNTIMDKAEKVYAFEESEDGCEPMFKWYRKRRLADKMYEFCSDEDDEDMENIRPPAKSVRTTHPARDNSFECEIMKSDRLKDESNKECNLDVRENIEEPKYLVESLRGKRMDLTRDRRNEWECKRRREQLEVRAVVGTDSRDCDNKCDIHQRRLDETSFRINGESHKNPAVPQQNVLDSISDIINCDNLDKLTMGESTSSKVEPLPSKSELHKMLDVSVINPDLSAILAEWEAESVSSLSPKSDTFLYKNGESKNDVIQSFLDLIPGMTISPRSSNSGSRISEHSCSEANENISPKVNEGPHSTSRLSSPSSPLASKYSPLLVVLRPRNCNQDKDPQRSKEQDDKCKMSNKDETTTRVKPVKDQDLTMRQRMISGCSVRFDRIYIEVDEEIISTITDIEDDDQGTGFHCALPLSVHGSAYAQLQMISGTKAEKMNIHCERVYQTSLDIEQFCFKAAEIICKCEGFKFWFCNDYDVEIIDVCAFNGDILGVVCLRLNAEKKTQKNERHSQRYFYVVRCVFVWNPGTDRCWLEAYSPLVDVTKHVNPVNTNWAPAKGEAARLRKALRYSTLFMLPSYPPIRTLSHHMWSSNQILVPTLEEIRDHANLIGFRLLRVPRYLGRIAEFE